MFPPANRAESGTTTNPEVTRFRVGVFAREDSIPRLSFLARSCPSSLRQPITSRWKDHVKSDPGEFVCPEMPANGGLQQQPVWLYCRE